MKSLFQMHDRAVLTKISESKARTAQPGKIVTPSGPVIQKPSVEDVQAVSDEYTKKAFQLMRSYIPKPNDDPFIFSAYLFTFTPNPPVVFSPSAGNEAVFFTYKVPSNKRMIITGFCFSLLCDDSPVASYPVFCEPLEHFGELYFDIMINGSSAVINKTSMVLATLPPTTIELPGFNIVSKDPERDSKVSPVGFAISINGGAKVEIKLGNNTNVGGGYLWNNVRDVKEAAAYLRGFFTDELEMKER